MSVKGALPRPPSPVFAVTWDSWVSGKMAEVQESLNMWRLILAAMNFSGCNFSLIFSTYPTLRDGVAGRSWWCGWEARVGSGNWLLSMQNLPPDLIQSI